MPRPSLRVKVLASFILILLPVLGLLIYGYRDANERCVQTVLDNQMQTAQAVAGLVDTSFDEALALLWALANDPVVHTLDPSQIDPHLQRLAPRYPQIEIMGVFDAAGNDVGRSIPYPPGATRINVADRPYFQQLMATGEPVIGSVLIGRVRFLPSVPVCELSTKQVRDKQ